MNYSSVYKYYLLQGTLTSSSITFHQIEAVVRASWLPNPSWIHVSVVDRLLMTDRRHTDTLVDKRYKAGTSKLVTWLAESAQLCDRRQNATVKKSQRRKVSTDELLVFAQRVVDSKDPIIEITVDILDITKVSETHPYSSRCS